MTLGPTRVTYSVCLPPVDAMEHVIHSRSVLLKEVHHPEVVPAVLVSAVSLRSLVEMDQLQKIALISQARRALLGPAVL